MTAMSPRGRAAPRACYAWGIVWLSVASIFFTPARASSQTPVEHWEFWDFYAPRLTVRPRDLAIAPRTARAGFQPVDSSTASLEPEQVYVPPQCVGTRRCPVLFWDNVSQNAVPNDLAAEKMMSPLADQYGFILVDFYPAYISNESLTLLFRNFAIDPDRIGALSSGSSSAMIPANQDKSGEIFSRIALWAVGGGASWVGSVAPPNGRIEFFFMNGLYEGPGTMPMGQYLKRLGHRVKTGVTARNEHASHPEDIAFAMRWMLESWATPDPAARPAPATFPEVRLTPAAVAKMTTFWSRFMQEPDSIRRLARREHQQEVRVPFGAQQLSARIMDVAAMAKRYPSVATALEQAGLTAAQHQAYRIALISALYAEIGPDWVLNAVEPTSAQGQNLDFVGAHPEELQALAATLIWRSP